MRDALGVKFRTKPASRGEMLREAIMAEVIIEHLVHHIEMLTLGRRTLSARTG
jgi:hypothetical protein